MPLLRRSRETMMPIDINKDQAALLLHDFFKEGNIQGIINSLEVYNIEAHKNDPKFKEMIEAGVQVLIERQKTNPEFQAEYQKLIDKLTMTFIDQTPRA